MNVTPASHTGYPMCGEMYIGGRKLNIPLGSNIRRLRISCGMTQGELAHHLCVSIQAVSKWERGYSYPDTSLLLPIAERFDVTLDELFGRTDNSENNKQRPSSV